MTLTLSALYYATHRQRAKHDKERAAISQQSKTEDGKRSHLMSAMSTRHYQRQLTAKAFRAWRMTIQYKWKQRLEVACQVQACLCIPVAPVSSVSVMHCIYLSVCVYLYVSMDLYQHRRGLVRNMMRKRATTTAN